MFELSFISEYEDMWGQVQTVTQHELGPEKAQSAATWGKNNLSN